MRLEHHLRYNGHDATKVTGKHQEAAINSLPNLGGMSKHTQKPLKHKSDPACSLHWLLQGQVSGGGVVLMLRTTQPFK